MIDWLCQYVTNVVELMRLRCAEHVRGEIGTAYRILRGSTFGKGDILRREDLKVVNLYSRAISLAVQYRILETTVLNFP